jgi:hypothetical protein
MGNTYWVDADSPSEASPYDTQAKAAHTLATILAIPPAAGDTIYCCAGASVGETIGAELDVASSGSNSGGFIKLIGCNPSGTNDGTRYIIDGGAAGINIFDFAGYDYWWLENIQVQNTGAGTKHGFYNSTGTSVYCVYINCRATSCTKAGFHNSVGNNSIFYRCLSDNNYNGFGYGEGAFGARLMLLCAAHSNTNMGFYYSTGTTYVGCISHGNTEEGYGSLLSGHVLINCVADSNADNGIDFAASSDGINLIFGCRITNAPDAGDYGLDANAEPVLIGYNYFEQVSGTNINTTTTADDLIYTISEPGGTTDSNRYGTEDDTNQGYAAAVGSHNFATGYTDATDPTLRRTAITIPWS